MSRGQTAAARTAIVVALAVLLRAQLWLPFAAMAGVVAVGARRRWSRTHRWLPRHVALVALAHSMGPDRRSADSVAGVTAPARERELLIDRAAARLRSGHDIEAWAGGVEQLMLLSTTPDAPPPRRRPVRPLTLFLASAALLIIAVVLQAHPGVFVGAFVATLVAAADLREEHHWRPDLVAAHAVRASRDHPIAADGFPLSARLVLLAGSRSVLERAARLTTGASASMPHHAQAIEALDDAWAALPDPTGSARRAGLRLAVDVVLASVTLWAPL